MDEDRRRTLLLLLELSNTSDARSCWDNDRAERLLRNETTPDELRELGADPEHIDRIFKDQ